MRFGESRQGELLFKVGLRPCFLSSDFAFKATGSGAKNSPETARGAFEKACRGLGFDRISKIRFCRFHKVSICCDIKPVFEGSTKLVMDFLDFDSILDPYIYRIS